MQGLSDGEKIYERQSGNNKLAAIGGIIAVAILLGALMANLGPGSKIGQGWAYLTNSSTNSSQQSPASASSVIGGPSLSAVQVNTILSNAGSPAAGTGQEFVLDSAQYDVDDAYALAFFKHESSFGKYGAAAQTLSIGNINCSDGYNCIGRFRAYSSWSEGIDDWYQLIKNVYVGQGLTTVESIIPHYAPNSDGNSESSYIASVESDVQAWRQG